MGRLANADIEYEKTEDGLPLFSVNKWQDIKRPNTDKIDCFEIQNRRYLGNKYKLLSFIEEIVAKKMNRQHIKSRYCLKDAHDSFKDLIRNANCQHILFSYNNTKESKDGRSNAITRKFNQPLAVKNILTLK